MNYHRTIWRSALPYATLAAFCSLMPMTATAATVVVNVSNPGTIQDRVGVDPVATAFQFTVPAGGSILDLDVQIAIAHARLLDLAVYLESPEGTLVDLLDAVFGAPAEGNGANFQDTRLDDAGSGPIGTAGFETAPFAGPDWGGIRYKPQYYVSDPTSRLSAFNGENPQGTWTLRVWDDFPGNQGTLYGAGQTAPWGTAFGTKLIFTLQDPAAVVDQHIFYNQSAFDGNNAAANDADDGAIAPDKEALLPGGTAAFANYTSFSKGINGIMVDISGLAGTPALSDFTFRVGNDSTPSGWAIAPNPISMTLRAGDGTGGSDRITFIWANNAIQKQWLQVTTKATANTGLTADDVFYFGNAIGECGNNPANTLVSGTDLSLTRANPRSPLNPAPITFVYDFNRDGLVGGPEISICRAHATSPLTALQLIIVP